MVEHPSFHALEAYGPILIPYLVHVMTTRGASWVILSLLRRLINEEVVPPAHAGNFYLQIADYLNWFCTSKYHDCGVYYGLV